MNNKKSFLKRIGEDGTAVVVAEFAPGLGMDETNNGPPPPRGMLIAAPLR